MSLWAISKRGRGKRVDGVSRWKNYSRGSVLTTGREKLSRPNSFPSLARPMGGRLSEARGSKAKRVRGKGGKKIGGRNKLYRALLLVLSDEGGGGGQRRRYGGRGRGLQQLFSPPPNFDLFSTQKRGREKVISPKWALSRRAPALQSALTFHR